MTTATATGDVELEPAPAPPRAGSGRMVGLDVARGIALLGMVSVHVYFDSTAWWTTVASGRASVLFITLAGLVVSMLHLRGSSSAEPGYLRRRGWALVGVGLIMVFSYWGSTILHYYGVLFLLAPWLLKRSTRCLAGIAAAAIVVGPVLMVVLEPHVTWADDLPMTSYVVCSTLVQMTTGLYPLPVWIGFFVVGVIVARFDFARLRNALILVGIGSALAVTVTLVSDALPWHPSWMEESVSSSSDASSGSDSASGSDGASSGEGSEGAPIKGWLSPFEDEDGFAVALKDDGSWTKTEDPWAAENGGATDWASLNDLSPHSNRMPWALQSLGIALAIIGLFVALPRRVLRLFRPIAVLGSMTLSAYIIHPFFVQDVWEWSGAPDNPGRQLPVLLGIFAVLILGAMVIRRRWSQGPLEWLLKRISGRPTSQPPAAAPTTIKDDMPTPSSLRTTP